MYSVGHPGMPKWKSSFSASFSASRVVARFVHDSQGPKDEKQRVTFEFRP